MNSSTVFDAVTAFIFWPIDLAHKLPTRTLRFFCTFPAAVLVMATMLLAAPVLLLVVVLEVWEQVR